MDNVLGVIGLAVVDNGFRAALFKAGQDWDTQFGELVALLASVGFTLNYGELTRVKKLTRKVETDPQKPNGPKEKARVDKARQKAAERLHKHFKDALDSGLQPPAAGGQGGAGQGGGGNNDQLATSLVNKLVDTVLALNSPGSLEGVLALANDIFCPVWPCDPWDA